MDDPITIILVALLLVCLGGIAWLVAAISSAADKAAASRRGYTPTRPPASLVPPSGEAARSPITPPPGRARPFTGDADIQAQIKRFIEDCGE